MGFDNGKYNSLYVLGHEIHHAYDHDKLGIYPEKLYSESNSLNFTNYLRSVYGDGDNLRTFYTGIPDIKLSNKEYVYNNNNEKIGNFEETYNKDLDNGISIKGFSYEKTIDGEKTVYYMLTVKNGDNSFHYVIFNSKSEYQKRLKYLNKYLKENEGE